MYGYQLGYGHTGVLLDLAKETPASSLSDNQLHVPKEKAGVFSLITVSNLCSFTQSISACFLSRLRCYCCNPHAALSSTLH